METSFNNGHDLRTRQLIELSINQLAAKAFFFGDEVSAPSIATESAVEAKWVASWVGPLPVSQIIRTYNYLRARTLHPISCSIFKRSTPILARSAISDWGNYCARRYLAPFVPGANIVLRPLADRLYPAQASGEERAHVWVRVNLSS